MSRSDLLLGLGPSPHLKNRALCPGLGLKREPRVAETYAGRETAGGCGECVRGDSSLCSLAGWRTPLLWQKPAPWTEGQAPGDRRLNKERSEEDRVRMGSGKIQGLGKVV